jgi:uncharacterized protein (DUF1501 family)
VDHSRRWLLRTSGVALAALGTSGFGLPGFLERAARAGAPAAKKALVVLFLRGGADGLSVVPPLGDPAYASLRPNLALAPAGRGDRSALPLESGWGLHPALAPLLPLWKDGALALVVAAGQPSPSRSHFDAQDYMEAGTPGTRATQGFLNRALEAGTAEPANPFRAVAVQPRLPRSLWGPQPALSVGALDDLQLRGGPAGAVATPTFEALYADAVDRALRDTGGEAFSALHEAASGALSRTQQPQNGAAYPPGPLAQRLRDIARLIHADVGLEIAATEAGGFDTHVQQGAEQGQLANQLRGLGGALAAFAQDLGPKLGDVCVVAMTEFGRTARENGTRGTDHGTASVMLALGGIGIRGGRVHGRWPGLGAAQLYEGRDLAVTTDYRAVLAEVLSRHLRLPAVERVFPGYAPAPVGLFA